MTICFFINVRFLLLELQLIRNTFSQHACFLLFDQQRMPKKKGLVVQRIVILQKKSLSHHIYFLGR